MTAMAIALYAGTDSIAAYGCSRTLPACLHAAPATAEPRKKSDATARSMLTPKADAVSKSCSL